MPLSQLRTWARNFIPGRDARPRPRRPGRPRLEWLEDRLTPDAVSWTGAGDGINWSDARNWSSVTRLPGPADDVTVDAPGTVVLHASGTDSVHSLQSENALVLSGGSLALAADSAVDNTLVLNGGTLSAGGPLSINALEQTSGTLNGAGAVTIQGQWDWSGGTQSGSGRTDLLGNADLSGGASSPLQLSGRAVDSDGTATLLAGSALNFASGAAWNNQSDGTFVLQGGGTLTGSGQFNNAGLLLKSDAGTSSVNVALNNSGTVEVQAGALGVVTGSSSGDFNIEAGASLVVSNSAAPAYAFLDGAAVTGDGTLQLGAFNLNNSLTVSGAVSVQNLSVNAGTVTVSAGASLDVQNLSLNLVSSTLTGPGDVTVEGTFTWADGILSGTGDTVLAGTTAIGKDLAGGQTRLDRRTVDNHGAATLLRNDTLTFTNGATWNNHADATLVLQRSTLGGNSTGGVVNNDGLVEVVSFAVVNVTFNNLADGTVDVPDGAGPTASSLLLTSGSSAGNFNIGPLSAVQFQNSPAGYAFVDGATSTGGGRVLASPLFVNITVSGGVSLQRLVLFGGTVTVTAGASLDVQSLDLEEGTLTGPGDVTVANDFIWRAFPSNPVSGTGRLFLEGTSTIGGSGSPCPLVDRTVNNDGTATIARSNNGAPGLSIHGNGVWNNDAGATTVLQGGVDGFFAGPQAAFNNAGLLRPTGATSVILNVPLSNADTGTIDVQAANFQLNGPFQTSGTVTIEPGATFFTPGPYTQTGGTPPWTGGCICWPTPFSSTAGC
jgi:hypothetical protein